MENYKTQSVFDVRSSNGTQMANAYSGLQSSQLMKLFEDELKDIYWVEHALTETLPEMIENATSDELIEALELHLEETEEHITRLEQVFTIVGLKPTAKKCEAMEGLIIEAENIMEESEEGAMKDAGIIAAAQKVEHYEIASYGILRQFAETLGIDEAADLLQATLDEEKAANEKLTQIAVSSVNVEASKEENEEFIEEDEDLVVEDLDDEDDFDDDTLEGDDLQEDVEENGLYQKDNP